MLVKALIEELEKQNPNDEVILWEWTKNGSRWQFLSILCEHSHPTGAYEIGINEHMPAVFDRSELEKII